MKQLTWLFLMLIIGLSSYSQENSIEKGFNVNRILDDVFQTYPNINHEDICIDSLKEFNNLFIVSLFADDAGCQFEFGYFNEEKFSNWKNISKSILDQNGFKIDSLNTILLFNNLILNQNESLLTNKDANMPDSLQFKKPNAKFHGDKIICEAWISKHSMMCSHPFSLMQSVFDIKGNLLSFKSIEYINIPCD
jgi:hypothetical protein